jgi:hypothetical protein
VAVLFAAVLTVGATACGYRAGPVLPEGVRTVAIPVFDNDTFRREIELELTQAVVREFSARTPLRILADPEKADLVVRGRILSFEERVLADKGRNTITESSVVVSVRIDLENRIDGSKTKRTLTIREPYSTFKGQTLASARAEAFENLAEQIAYALEGDRSTAGPVEAP